MNIKELATQAQLKGICNLGLNRILASNDKESLLRYFIEGLDFCLAEDFPNKEYLKQEGGSLLPKYGIHIDENCTLINRDRIILLGECEASIACNSYAISDLFIKHNSKAKVYTSDHAFMRIDCFDNSEVFIHAEGNAKVFVNVFGKAIVTYLSEGKSTVKIINKGKDRY